MKILFIMQQCIVEKLPKILDQIHRIKIYNFYIIKIKYVGCVFILIKYLKNGV
jgi:hypothetical protein